MRVFKRGTLFKPVFLDFTVQRSLRDVQFLGSLLASATIAFERFLDGFPLGVFKGHCLAVDFAASVVIIGKVWCFGEWSLFVGKSVFDVNHIFY